MDSRVVAALNRPAVRIWLVALLALFLLFARRYAQMLDPQVWDEEGIIISQIVLHGIASIFEPINGYLIVLPRLLSMAAMLFPFYEYPIVVTVLSWAVTVAILVAITFVPSRLHGGPLLIIVAMFVPTDAEVYGVSLYVFWWAVLLLYAAAFWRSERRIMWLRFVAIVLGGLSSPVIILAAPLFVLNAVRKGRTREEIVAAVAAIACALAQAFELIRSHGGFAQVGVATIAPFVTKFIGGYVIWNLLGANEGRDRIALLCGIFSLGFVAAAFWRNANLRESLILLVYLWLGSAALSLARVDLIMLDQARSGPRYFFLPFVVEGWILVQIVTAARSAAFRWIAAAMLLCVAFNALPSLSRRHDDLAWQSSVAACAAAGDLVSFAIPIEYDGNAATHWVLGLTGRQCKQLGRFGLVGLTF